MNVTVEVVGEGSHDLEVEDATYADLLAEVDLSPHEVSVMVDGRPVPEDRPVETDHVKVLRLIKGGSGAAGEEADLEAPTPSRTPTLGVSELDFELPNAGTGPDPFGLAAVVADDDAGPVERSPLDRTTPRHDAVVLLFQRDYRCRGCRRQVREVADRYREFRDRNALVVSVLPESKKRAEKWQEKYHLPFPLVADADGAVADQYGQPVRFGPVGRLHDLLGRMPEAAILDARGELRLYAVHRGDRPGDRPPVDDVLAMVDRMLDDDRGRPTG